MKKFSSKSQKIGKLGEDVACKFLMKHNFSIIERNYTQKWGEIDIVAQKDNKLYFIEVKSVSRQFNENINIDKKELNPFSFSRPEENMHPWKLKRLSRVVQTYLIQNRIGNREWQFDLLLVYLDTDKRLAKVKTISNIIL